MPGAGEVLKSFYDAVIRKDVPAARRFLKDGLLFERMTPGSPWVAGM